MQKKDYAKMARTLRPYVSLGTRRRVHFTTAEKRNITRQYNKIKWAIDGPNTFIRTNRQDVYRKAGIKGITNKGVFVKGTNTRARVVNGRLRITYKGGIKTEFIPKPAHVPKVLFGEWAKNETLDRDRKVFNLAVGGIRSTDGFYVGDEGSAELMEEYVDDFITSLGHDWQTILWGIYVTI